MIRVHNSKVISNISRRSLKANRARNRIAVCAIALTSVLFTSLFTIGGSMLKTMERSTCRQVGTEAHAGYKYLTQAEYDAVKAHPSIRDISYDIYMAIGENTALDKLHTELRYSEDKNARWSFAYPETGTMPQAYRELAASTLVLDALGVPHELGQKVTLDFTVRGKTYHETFTLCGFWEGDPIAMAQEVWLSKEFVLDTAPLSTVSFYERSDYDTSGTINCAIWFSNTFNLEGKITKVTTDSGYTPDTIRQAVNWAYSGAEIDLTTLALILAILLLITASGYLIIFNVFYISVAKDIRYYGLLKTIGTTGKQLRKIVRRQALLLSCAGVPIGLALGYGAGVLLLPLIIDNSYYAGQSAVSANPIIFLAAALFSLVTVLISCRRPEKLASSVSPMEALRYYEAAKPGKKSRRSKRSPVSAMAAQNVFRSRRKLLSVALSLSLSMILLSGVYTIVNGFNLDKYLEDRVIADFSVSNARLLSQYEFLTVSADSLAQLNALPGVSETGCVYMTENHHVFTGSGAEHLQRILDERLNLDYNSKYTAETISQFEADQTSFAHIYGIDRLIFDKLKVLDGVLDYAAFQSGDYVYVSTYNEEDCGLAYPYYKVGDRVTLDYGNGDVKEYTVLGIAEIPYSASCFHGHFIDPDFILPSTEYLRHAAEQLPLHVMFNAEAGESQALAAAVSACCDGTELSFVSRETVMAEFQDLMTMFLVVGGLLSAILGLIGILNFLNSILSSILSRRRELAMLQSVGMTVRQLRCMLILEGLIYALITLLIVFTVGNLLVFGLVRLIAAQLAFFTYRFTLTPLLACLPVILLLSWVIPVLSYRSLRHESIVERLREAE